MLLDPTKLELYTVRSCLSGAENHNDDLCKNLQFSLLLLPSLQPQLLLQSPRHSLQGGIGMGEGLRYHYLKYWVSNTELFVQSAAVRPTQSFLMLFSAERHFSYHTLLVD